jgi:hypothetical protein
LGVVLTERLPGEHPPSAEPAAAERVARAAALLHACPAQLEPRVEMEAALANLERRARLLERRVPAAGARALGLAERARAGAGRLAPERSAPLNGDMSVSSFLLDREHTYLLDWDIACSFDPAWDLGHYVLQLFRLGHVQGVDTGPARRSFLAAYRGAAGATDGSLEERVAFYEGVVAIHKAFTVCAGGGAGAASLVDALLDLAAARLGVR